MLCIMYHCGNPVPYHIQADNVSLFADNFFDFYFISYNSNATAVLHKGGSYLHLDINIFL